MASSNAARLKGTSFSMKDEQGAMAEYKYWTELTSTVQRGLSKSSVFGERLLWDLAYFDTSIECVNSLFSVLANGEAEAPCAAICKLLKDNCNINVSESDVEDACEKINFDLHGDRSRPRTKADFVTFCVLWQRFLLGAVYNEAALYGHFDASNQNRWYVIRYGRGFYEDRRVTECEWAFGTCFAKAAFFLRGRREIIWLRVDDAQPSELIRMGIKMYLHPMLIEDLLSTRLTCITQVTNYQEHVCICLELYYLHEDDVSEDDSSDDSSSQGSLFRIPSKGVVQSSASKSVGPSVRRGVVTFVAPTLSAVNQTSVLTVADSNERLCGRGNSTVTNFTTSQAGVKAMLNDVQRRAESHFQLREEPAVALVYIMLNAAARQGRLVCEAYAERLTALKSRISGRARRRRRWSELSELTNTCLELNELLQWVERLDSVVEYLEGQARGQLGESEGNKRGGWTNQRPTAVADWSLPLISNMRQVICRSKVNLLQQSEQAQQLKNLVLRSRQDLGDNALFIFSVIGSSYFPAQFLTGVFGMNFAHMPILSWRHGYVCFWLFSGLLVVAVPLSIICCIQFLPNKDYLMGFSVLLAFTLWLATGSFSWESDY